MSTRKPWTVLVWIAGDNNLDEFGLKDIAEMKAIGSSERLDILVQFDRAGKSGTRRYHLQAGTQLDADLVEDIGETNTGDPAVATAFFTWGMQRCPSEHVLAVLWNHGSGIDETDVYRGVRSRGVAHRIAAGPMRRALFSTTVQAAKASRAIAYDDDARDFIDNKELRKVLQDVTTQAGRPIDVLGFDACLMNMVEIGYDLREFAGHMVGSEQTEPGNGWPYDRVLRILADRPGASPAELAAGAVEGYLASYGGDSEDVTLSALDLAKVGPAADAIDDLARDLIVALDGGFGTISRAIKNVQRFELNDFADLGDFCRLVGAAGGDVLAAAQAVLDAIAPPSGLVVKSGHHGGGVERATGVAIYLPLGHDVSVVYDELEFATKTRWNQFLQAYAQA
jgi:hypothetical protein